MIYAHHRYFQNAHRISDYDLDPSIGLDQLFEGQWLMFNASRKLVISDGTGKSYLTTSSRRTGRDPVKESGKVVILVGPYRCETDQWDTTKTYLMNQPLKVVAGKVLPFITGGTPDTRWDLIVGHVTKVPTGPTDTIEFIHE